MSLDAYSTINVKKFLLFSATALMTYQKRSSVYKFLLLLLAVTRLVKNVPICFSKIASNKQYQYTKIKLRITVKITIKAL